MTILHTHVLHCTSHSKNGPVQSHYTSTLVLSIQLRSTSSVMLCKVSAAVLHTHTPGHWIRLYHAEKFSPDMTLTLGHTIIISMGIFNTHTLRDHVSHRLLTNSYMSVAIIAFCSPISTRLFIYMYIICNMSSFTATSLHFPHIARKDG